MRLISLILLSTSFFIGGCATVTAQSGQTKIVDPGAEDNLGGTGTSSNDVRAMAESMARDIVGINWPKTGAEIQIAILPLENHTRFRIDPKLLQNRLVRDLVKYAQGRVGFLARDSEQAVMAERSKKRSGLYSSGEKAQAMSGADYLLKGEMRALSKSSREGVSDYIIYSFTLINSEKGTILWSNDYETKKEGTVGVVYQ